MPDSTENLDGLHLSQRDGFATGGVHLSLLSEMNSLLDYDKLFCLNKIPALQSVKIHTCREGCA